MAFPIHLSLRECTNMSKTLMPTILRHSKPSSFLNAGLQPEIVSCVEKYMDWGKTLDIVKQEKLNKQTRFKVIKH